MARSVDYYLSLASPWAYIGHGRFMDIVKKHDLSIRWKPIFLSQIFAETGGLPLPKRHPARQRYRLVDLQRWRDKRGLWFNIRPKYWPFDVNLIDRCIIAIQDLGGEPSDFVRRSAEALWEHEKNLADETTLRRLLTDAKLEPDKVLARARSEAIEQTYEQNMRDAVEVDVFGSPSYVVDGEVFWGQDRLDLLDDMLASGRPPYTPLT